MFIKGSHHQGDLRYSAFSRNKQCTAMSASACAFSIHTPISLWNTTTIDTILKMGDSLYHQTRHLNELRGIFEDYLAAIEIPSNFTFENNEYNIRIQEHTDDIFRGNNFHNRLHDFFQTCSRGIITSCGLSMAIFKLDNGKFGLFDSHARHMHGRVNTNGTAVFTFHENLHSLVHTLLHNFGNPIFPNCTYQFSIASISLGQRNVDSSNTTIGGISSIVTCESKAQRRKRFES